jgi:hypothetical protein
MGVYQARIRHRSRPLEESKPMIEKQQTAFSMSSSQDAVGRICLDVVVHIRPPGES